MHVFSECLRYKKRRDKCETDIQKVILYAHQHVGEQAVSNLKEVLSNTTFQVTGICPDDMMALAMDTKKRDTEKVKEVVPSDDHMIYDETEGLVYEDHNGVNLPTAYTDGSLLDPDIDNFQRAGWGFFVAPGHPANVAKSLETSNPSVFRAELRALMHAIQVCATPIIIRTDCRAAYLLVQKIQNGEGYDVKHGEADILSVIANLKNDNCIIKWMPAHLDEADNIVKRDKYLEAGGTQAHIDGNCGADELAKQGADSIKIDNQRHDMYMLRTWLTKTVQNFLVDVWRGEKLRMYGDNINDPNDALEIQSILDIESIQLQAAGEHDDDGEPGEDTEQYQECDSYDDYFGNVDIDGNELQISDNQMNVTESNITLYQTSIKEAFDDINNSENVFYFSGAVPFLLRLVIIKMVSCICHIALTKISVPLFLNKRTLVKSIMRSICMAQYIANPRRIPIMGLSGIFSITTITLMLCRSLTLQFATSLKSERTFCIPFLRLRR